MSPLALCRYVVPRHICIFDVVFEICRPAIPVIASFTLAFNAPPTQDTNLLTLLPLVFDAAVALTDCWWILGSVLSTDIRHSWELVVLPPSPNQYPAWESTVLQQLPIRCSSIHYIAPGPEPSISETLVYFAKLTHGSASTRLLRPLRSALVIPQPQDMSRGFNMCSLV